MVASQGLEPQQAESESAVLPLHHEAIAFLFRLAGSTGLEPATPGSTVQCANQLRHNPVAPKSECSISYFLTARKGVNRLEVPQFFLGCRGLARARALFGRFSRKASPSSVDLRYNTKC